MLGLSDVGGLDEIVNYGGIGDEKFRKDERGQTKKKWGVIVYCT